MLNETIEIDCDKEQLFDINEDITDPINQGELMYFKTLISKGRISLLSWATETEEL